MTRHIKIPFTARCISMHLEPALILDIPVVFVNVKAAKIKISDFLFVCLLKRLGTGSTEPCKTIHIHVTNLSLSSRFSKVHQNAPSFPTIRFVKAPDIISHPLRSSATAAKSPFLFQFLQPFQEQHCQMFHIGHCVTRGHSGEFLSSRLGINSVLSTFSVLTALQDANS